MYLIGKMIFKRFSAPKKYNQKISDCLLQLYGREEYLSKLNFFWAQKYSFHIYTTLLMVILGLRETMSTRVFLLILGNFACHYYLYERLKEATSLHRESIIDGFFEFSALFTLMINAGLNYRNALECSIGDHAFSPYIRRALQEINTGVPEITAFGAIPTQCREVIITRYFNCIVQGQKYGNRDLRKDLKRITEENWQEKLKHHRKKGEILKTKLLAPMMMIFVGVLGILLMPVMIQFQSMM